ncbi:ATP-binding protein [Rhizobium ruizarguesonis]
MMFPVQALADLVVGMVEAVSPSEIVVSLGGETPQAIALNTGMPTPFPRINGYVLLPNESGATVAYVTWIGITRSPLPRGEGRQADVIDLPFPTRRMTVSPIGTLMVRSTSSTGDQLELSRGVRAFPSVGDQVLVPTAAQIAAIVGARDEDRRVQIGTSPLAMDADIMVDPDKIFGRHLAVLGNTGSGKSCSVAGLIRWSLDAATAEREKLGRQGRPNGRFIILDPNGEYRQAFADDPDNARIFRVPPLEKGETALKVPAWLWNGLEWSTLSHAQPGVQRPLLRQGLRELKSGYQGDLSEDERIGVLAHSYKTSIDAALAAGRQEYTGFQPTLNIGSILRALGDDSSAWSQAASAGIKDDVDSLEDSVLSLIGQRRNARGFWSDFAAAELQAISDALAPVAGAKPEHEEQGAFMHEDAPIPFELPLLTSHLEGLAQRQGSNMAGFIATLGLRIKSMLADRRLGSVIDDREGVDFKDWLETYVGADGASNGNVAVIDLSLIPSEIVHIVVSVLARLVFEALQRYRRKNDGETLPTVLVLEEAHNFVKGVGSSDTETWSASDLCRDVFERIAREGRKFGLGLLVSSQRPSELSPTLLAQCNTFLLHRIVNDADQRLVSKLVPDSVGGLLRELPSLPARHAVLLGWAAPIPILVEMRDLPKAHQPRSADPAYWDVWIGERDRPVDWQAIVGAWTE